MNKASLSLLPTSAFFALCLILSLLLGASVAFSDSSQMMEPKPDELRILDFEGTPRAVHAIDEKDVSIDCFIKNVAGQNVDNVEIKISNIQTQKEFTRRTLDGSVRFQGPDAGIWKLSSLTPGLRLSEIQIVRNTTPQRELEASAKRAVRREFAVNPVAATVGVLAAGGGAIAIVEAADDDSSSDRSVTPLPSPLSPSR